MTYDEIDRDEMAGWLSRVATELKMLDWKLTHTSKNKTTKRISSRYLSLTKINTAQSQEVVRLRLADHEIGSGTTASGEYREGSQRSGGASIDIVVNLRWWRDGYEDITSKEMAAAIDKIARGDYDDPAEAIDEELGL